MGDLGRWGCFSPIDVRYYEERLAPYLSENGFTAYKLKVELALVRALHRRGMCDEATAAEIEAACSLVTTAEVYEEEARIKHDIRALVNCIQRRVSDKAKPFVHMTATSFDIVDTANAARYKAAAKEVLIPALIELLEVLIGIAEREADTVQVGRTHGQHAVPITFGFAMAQYVERLGSSITRLYYRADELEGKFSGAVGAYNASSLFFDDPVGFEAEVLAELGLNPARISTQIAPPEPTIRLLDEVVLAAGVIANLARDMRNLQRTEIGEVGEAFGANQVGSSTMPQKRNPINFENVESLWKILMGRLVTVRLDQISDHQRDLTNSASGRTYGEIFCYVLSMTSRITSTMQRMSVDHDSLERNLALTKGMIVAEPLYIILASLGHPDAHEAVRNLTLQAQAKEVPLEEVVASDEAIQPYLGQMTDRQREILSNPMLYVGIAAEKARCSAADWEAVVADWKEEAQEGPSE